MGNPIKIEHVSEADAPKMVLYTRGEYQSDAKRILGPFEGVLSKDEIAVVLAKRMREELEKLIEKRASPVTYGEMISLMAAFQTNNQAERG